MFPEAVPVPGRHCPAHRITCFGSDDFEQRSESSAKRGVWGLAGIIWRIVFSVLQQSESALAAPFWLGSVLLLIKVGGFAFSTVSEPSPIHVNAFLAGSPEKLIVLYLLAGQGEWWEQADRWISK